MSLLLLAAVGRAGSLLHPDVALLDADGRSVLETNRPVSPERTCGECHDTAYIASHSYHALVGLDEIGNVGGFDWDLGPGMFGRWDPVVYRRLGDDGDLSEEEWVRIYGERHVGGGPAAKRGVEMNCFLCHLPRPANAQRIEALRQGHNDWAATATLAHTGLVEQQGRGEWRYVRDRFDRDGMVTQALLRINDPKAANCGLCHTQVWTKTEPLALDCEKLSRDTDCSGQVFSAQRVKDSALNLVGKEDLAQPWDVHAERLLECTDCHHALNNPVRFTEAERSRPAHLAYDARRLEISEYLKTPSHHFTKGESAQGNVARRLDGSMRRCEGCHNAEAIHEKWLPNPRRHLTTMLCESCHIPQVHAPARMQTDWTVLLENGGPRIEYRGVDGPPHEVTSTIHGYRPVILPRHQRDGMIRHGPHNLVTSWFWVAGEPARPVPQALLERAWFDEAGGYRPAIIGALDENGDGRLEASELRLDSEAKVDAIRNELARAGAELPRIAGSIQPASLHHGVVAGEFATRRCETCHTEKSRLTEPFELSSYVPAGATATLVGDTNITMPGRLYEEGGRLLYEPVPTASGRYVIGHDRAGWIDWVGALLVLGTIAGAAAHGLGRFASARRRDGGAA
jgi:hypothetical protein